MVDECVSFRKRDANLAKRGISTDSDSQIRAVEERGKELLEEYKQQLEVEEQDGDRDQEEEFKKRLLDRSQ